MDLETLNGYVLAVIALLAMLFYAAVVVGGFRDLISRLPYRADRIRRSQIHTAARRSRNAKRAK